VNALREVAAIAWRSIRRTLRQPSNAIVLVFPLMLMAVNSNGLKAATHLPGFPTRSFLAFFIPFTFIQGALFAASTAGTELGRDIDTGFLNRLALTPLRGSALLVGHLGGALAQTFIQALVYLGVGLLFGVRFVSGVAGMATLILLALCIGAGFASAGIWIALRTGSGEAVQAQIPVLFFLLFISSMNMPRNLIEVHWFRVAATLNPVSYMIEGMRSLVIEGWNGQALALGFGLSLAFVILAMTASSFALRKRMART
jgi:ABC-2 type transport system permease protein